MVTVNASRDSAAVCTLLCNRERFKVDVMLFIKELIVALLQWFWRRNEKGIMDGYPVKIHYFWYGFPEWVDHIDAIYESGTDEKITFFIGQYNCTTGIAVL